MNHHHNSGAFLEVARLQLRERLRDGRAHTGPGWYVRRTCDCHKREIVSIRFGTEDEGARCRQALDDDCRRSLSTVEMLA